MGYWDGFVFNHVREMKDVLVVLCRNLAKSQCRIEIRMDRCVSVCLFVCLEIP